MSADESPSLTPPPLPPRPIVSYRQVDPANVQWGVVQSFGSIAEWHAAKAVLERNGVLTRMGSNPYDDSTGLLVPVTEVLWAAELLHRAKSPAPAIEQALGFPMISMPPPLPASFAGSTETVQTDPAGAQRVLEIEPRPGPEDSHSFGCALTGLWVALILVLIFIVWTIATYAS